MKNKFNILILLLIAITWSSCEEADLPQNFVGEPIFNISANLDALPLSISAGADDFFMATTYGQINGAYQLKGTLLQINCNNCPEQLSFNFIHTADIINPEPFNIDEALTIGNYSFLSTFTTGVNSGTIVEIAYTSPDNIAYCSNLGEQPQSSFEVLVIEDFENNEFGQRTKKLTIRFTCDLYDVNNNVLHLTDGIGTIAVAYPG